ncbi:putative tRNA (adenine37-N6)-methyltransferase [Blattamonas nauphoetae]|uniref:tRNA (Adenine37-N6)-methyltransferase n=1 Tax=Blattamonas nauphoetae TaxID=2049346 RepID=A0ABQ9Y6R8_9EUKA|nr:putative tRNA (adenine37-N6)-methyltransferase [Blattamonas nauphoetae]
MFPFKSKIPPPSIKQRIDSYTPIPKVEQFFSTISPLPKTHVNVFPTGPSSLGTTVTLRLPPVGTVTGAFQRRNDAPRQPFLGHASDGQILFPFPLNQSVVTRIRPNMLLWVVFVFDRNICTPSRLYVAPPKYRGKRIGLFATRCPFRPNPIGLSLVAVKEIVADPSGSSFRILFDRGDLLTGTPVLAIRPYRDSLDFFPTARSGWSADPKAITPLFYDSHEAFEEDGDDSIFVFEDEADSKKVRRRGEGDCADRLLGEQSQPSLPVSTQDNIGEEYTIVYAPDPQLEAKLDWITEHTSTPLRDFIQTQLSSDPLLLKANKTRRKTRRPTQAHPAFNTLAVGSFRVLFVLDDDKKEVHVSDVVSGFRQDVMESDSSTDTLINLHHRFTQAFSGQPSTS